MSSAVEANLWAVVLAGGIGSRFWPVSTPSRPKQLLPLAGDEPLIRQTVERIGPLVPADRIRILTGAGLVDPIRGAVPALEASNLWLEPRARGTAPVLAWAAHRISRLDPSACMVSLHADHVIEPADVFLGQLEAVAAASVRHGRLFTIGAVPDRPETGYGYIRPGARLEEGAGLFAVDRFVEKPDHETAGTYVRDGYLWNTGIFVWPAGLLLDELTRHTPEIASRLALLDEDRVPEFFDRVPMLSIDEGLLERSPRVAVAEAAFSWDDVGAWDAVARTRTPDAAGNVGMGDVHLVESAGCIAWADAGTVVLYGTRDLVVVRTGDITFVAPRDRAPELKTLLAQLPSRLSRPEAQ
jgi:mannose-1-phosphate guanylyltransferase